MAPQKSRRDENFPVGSILIPRRHRAVVHAYYTYARNADDIADSSELSTDEKIARLEGMEETLANGSAPPGMHVTDQQLTREIMEHLSERDVPLTVASDLLIAFKKDARNETCRSWADLIDYCRFSACPVGRLLLAVHEEHDGIQESDALCTALQILNHVQDVRDDWASLKRTYVPTDWLHTAELDVNVLSETTTPPSLASIFQRMLSNTDQILTKAAPLPEMVRSRGLAAEAKVCITLAERLSARLKRADPLAARIKLMPMDWFASGTRGLFRLVRP